MIIVNNIDRTGVMTSLVTCFNPSPLWLYSRTIRGTITIQTLLYVLLWSVINLFLHSFRRWLLFPSLWCFFFILKKNRTMFMIHLSYVCVYICINVCDCLLSIIVLCIHEWVLLCSNGSYHLLLLLYEARWIDAVKHFYVMDNMFYHSGLTKKNKTTPLLMISSWV